MPKLWLHWSYHGGKRHRFCLRGQRSRSLYIWVNRLISIVRYLLAFDVRCFLRSCFGTRTLVWLSCSKYCSVTSALRRPTILCRVRQSTISTHPPTHNTCTCCLQIITVIIIIINTSLLITITGSRYLLCVYSPLTLFDVSTLLIVVDAIASVCVSFTSSSVTAAIIWEPVTLNRIAVSSLHVVGNLHHIIVQTWKPSCPGKVFVPSRLLSAVRFCRIDR